MLEFDDIQNGVLRPRPTPYAATYLVFRIDDRKAGRELIGRLCNVVAAARHFGTLPGAVIAASFVCAGTQQEPELRPLHSHSVCVV